MDLLVLITGDGSVLSIHTYPRVLYHPPQPTKISFIRIYSFYYIEMPFVFMLI